MAFVKVHGAQAGRRAGPDGRPPPGYGDGAGGGRGRRQGGSERRGLREWRYHGWRELTKRRHVPTIRKCYERAFVG